MALIEKNTMSGRDLRTYACRRCGREVEMDFGDAMWKLISEADR